MLARLNGPGTVNDLFEPLRLVRRQAARQAEFTERAAAACDLGAGGLTAIVADIGHPKGTFHDKLSNFHIKILFSALY
jgi:hypothetical protein